MTYYELMATVLSAVAIGVSGYAVWAQLRQQRENVELQRATAQLAKKQLEILTREDEARSRARISLDMHKEDRTKFRFVISNVGEAEARNVNLELLLENPADNPLIKSEVRSKLPAPKLLPGNSISLIAALHMGSPLAYRARLTWTNLDRSESVEETYVSL